MNLYDSVTYIEDLRESINNVVAWHRLQNKSILVTGATGTIGSFLVDMLMQCNRDQGTNIQVFASGRSEKRLSQRFNPIKTDELKYVEYDVTAPIGFDISVDYIIHAGGNAHPAAFNGNPVGTIMGNIAGTFQLLEYGRLHDTKRLLYISSGEIYGQGDTSLDSFEETYGGYLETTSVRSCYPMSKRATENLCSSYSQQYGLETVIVRPCHTYGPNITESDNRANVQFVRNILNGEDIIMKSEGTQMRSYCYIADCASAIITVLLNGKNGEAYNSANPDARTTIAGLAQTIAEAAGRKVIFANPDAVDLAHRTPIAKQVLSSDKLIALGWTGKYSVERGVAHMLDILQGK